MSFKTEPNAAAGAPTTGVGWRAVRGSGLAVLMGVVRQAFLGAGLTPVPLPRVNAQPAPKETAISDTASTQGRKAQWNKLHFPETAVAKGEGLQSFVITHEQTGAPFIAFAPRGRGPVGDYSLRMGSAGGPELAHVEVKENRVAVRSTTGEPIVELVRDPASNSWLVQQDLGDKDKRPRTIADLKGTELSLTRQFRDPRRSGSVAVYVRKDGSGAANVLVVTSNAATLKSVRRLNNRQLQALRLAVFVMPFALERPPYQAAAPARWPAITLPPPREEESEQSAQSATTIAPYGQFGLASPFLYTPGFLPGEPVFIPPCFPWPLWGCGVHPLPPVIFGGYPYGYPFPWLEIPFRIGPVRGVVVVP